MFHVKHLITKLKNIPLHEIIFILFVFFLPTQARIIFNNDQAYIGSIFSYHKAIFLYGTDILFALAYISFIWTEKAKPNKWLILAIFAGCLSWFHVEQWNIYWFYMIKALEFWLIIDYVKQSNVSRATIYKTLIVSGVIQAILGILQFHVQHGFNIPLSGEYVPGTYETGAATLAIGTDKILRAYGTFPHPNVLGGFLALILAIILFVSRETKSIKQTIWLSLGGIIVLWGGILTFSRSAWIAMAAAIGIWGIWLIYNKALKQAFILTIVVIVSCGTLFLSYKTYIVPRATDVSPDSQAAEYRSEFNQEGIQIIKANPLIGAGLGQYIIKHEQLFHVEQWRHQPPHNILLFLLTQVGFIGVLIYIATYIKLGFTWNILKNGLNIMFIVIIIILGSLDHYLISIQQGLLIFALICGLMIKKDVSRAVKHLE